MKLPFINKKNNTILDVVQMREMSRFYEMLLKMQNRRVYFNAARVMQQVYTKVLFKKFIKEYQENLDS